MFLGEAMVELTSTSADTTRWTFAGDALNAAAACAATSPSGLVRFLTGLGTDALSDRLVERCQLLGIDTSGSVRIDGRTLGLYWIDVDDGERRFRYWRDSSAARAALESGSLIPALVEASHVVWSGITLAVAGAGGDRLVDAVADSRAAGTTICLDVNHRAGLWPDSAVARHAIDAALAQADVVIASAEDIGALWSTPASDFAERALTHGAREVVVSDGPRRAVCFTAEGSVAVVPDRVTVVDTAGAGDALWGTYLGRRSDGVDVESALQAAVGAAQRAVGHAGALGYLDVRSSSRPPVDGSTTRDAPV